MRINPIVKKDVKVQARSMRICWEVFVYEAIMALVFFLAMFMFRQQSAYSYNNIYSSIVWLYPALAVTQILILGVVVPIRTASAIAGEKERQTFDIMMTTSMTPFSIIFGKVMIAVIQSMFYVVAGLPIVALAFVIGGLPWSNLFLFLAVALLVSFFSASIGIFCSSVCRKTISAVIMSYGIYVVFFVGTFVPYLLSSMLSTDQGSSMEPVFFLLLNPAMYLLEFFAWSMRGVSVVKESFVIFTSNQMSRSDLFIHGGWMLVSTALFIVVSLVFLLIAARRINPLAGHHAGKKEGKKHGR